MFKNTGFIGAAGAHAMRRVVPIRHILYTHAMRTRECEYTGMRTAWHARAAATRARISARERAHAERAAAAAAGRRSRKTAAACPEPQVVQLLSLLKKLTTLLAGGEAHALLTRAPPHSRDAPSCE